MSLSVVNLGLPKSGTTTLARALTRAGLRVADHRLFALQSTEHSDGQKPKQKFRFVGDLLYRAYFETGDPGAYLKGYDALTEINLLRGNRSLWPQTDFALLEALRAHHPGLKFIATWRDPSDIATSIANWNNLGTTRLPARDVPGMPAGYGRDHGQMTRWIAGHYVTLATYFRNDPDYLELQVGDPNSQENLAQFVGFEIPWWGRANANRSKLQKVG